MLLANTHTCVRACAVYAQLFPHSERSYTNARTSHNNSASEQEPIIDTEASSSCPSVIQSATRVKPVARSENINKSPFLPAKLFFLSIIHPFQQSQPCHSHPATAPLCMHRSSPFFSFSSSKFLHFSSSVVCRCLPLIASRSSPPFTTSTSTTNLSTPGTDGALESTRTWRSIEITNNKRNDRLRQGNIGQITRCLILLWRFLFLILYIRSGKEMDEQKIRVRLAAASPFCLHSSSSPLLLSFTFLSYFLTIRPRPRLSSIPYFHSFLFPFPSYPFPIHIFSVARPLLSFPSLLFAHSLSPFRYLPSLSTSTLFSQSFTLSIHFFLNLLSLLPAPSFRPLYHSSSLSPTQCRSPAPSLFSPFFLSLWYTSIFPPFPSTIRPHPLAPLPFLSLAPLPHSSPALSCIPPPSYCPFPPFNPHPRLSPPPSPIQPHPRLSPSFPHSPALKTFPMTFPTPSVLRLLRSDRLIDTRTMHCSRPPVCVRWGRPRCLRPPHFTAAHSHTAPSDRLLFFGGP
ncbi:hypothetical protein C7M84_022877 [Penaeus vannamei]|uniref:Uncharacterized protein n=1 Tax=Penaeus vannamei TaxID=6689 RepID=A0A423UBE2_PENVA|nr:hypothetical protein C7M84_022877 [Penaeus vannamei]